MYGPALLHVRMHGPGGHCGQHRPQLKRSAQSAVTCVAVALFYCIMTSRACGSPTGRFSEIVRDDRRFGSLSRRR
eukprot:4459406-Prymnesium_polylepis.1